MGPSRRNEMNLMKEKNSKIRYSRFWKKWFYEHTAYFSNWRSKWPLKKSKKKIWPMEHLLLKKVGDWSYSFFFANCQIWMSKKIFEKKHFVKKNRSRVEIELQKMNKISFCHFLHSIKIKELHQIQKIFKHYTQCSTGCPRK